MLIDISAYVRHLLNEESADKEGSQLLQGEKYAGTKRNMLQFFISITDIFLVLILGAL